MDILEGPPDELYALFQRVYDRLNGDVFPITTSERQAVRPAHLQAVADFLRGRPDGQLNLFPLYDFSVVPAELLSNVYEEFLIDVQRERGVHYTPEHIADLVLDETFPENGKANLTVLDPACGSGTFLARAYRRLIHERAEKLGRPLEPRELADLLSRSVFGCDLLESAVKVAALSCYLVLLEHCSSDEIASGVRLPQLYGTNLLVGDFFALEAQLRGPFDVIASNPPWQSKLGEAATEFAQRHELAIGDEQIAQAFFAACAQRISSRGRAGLLMPAKVLYNQGDANRLFRRWAIEETIWRLSLTCHLFAISFFTARSRRWRCSFSTATTSPFVRS